MTIRSLRIGSLATNCYIVWDEQGEAVLIDTAGSGAELLQLIVEQRLKLRYIINTHGHFDHITANKIVAEETGAQLLIHEDDAEYLTNNNYNLAGVFASQLVPWEADRLLQDEEAICWGLLELKVLHTPGHTPGGICLLGEGVLFTGDTLFAGSVGRTDLVGGDKKQLEQSITGKLLPLDDEVVVYPGHGAPSTMEWEKKYNPYLYKHN
ncbi:MAG: MBL fold metallo-hydrolase [Symbiobacteriaceae bacterium]|nr:MBL fold metallo-hydrolase [Symbiobacteriaceae bacterium]